MIGPAKRWVEKKGNVVRFGNYLGGYFGKTYVYEFPTQELASKFANLARSKDKLGNPRGIPSAQWGMYEKRQGDGQ